MTAHDTTMTRSLGAVALALAPALPVAAQEGSADARVTAAELRAGLMRGCCILFARLATSVASLGRARIADGGKIPVAGQGPNR